MLWIINFWARFYAYQTKWVEDLPCVKERNTIYIVGGKAYPFYAAIVCPKRKCKQSVCLDISPDSESNWKLTEHSNGQVSLFPSVQVTGLPCGCHYWFQNGRIRWCEMPGLIVPEANRHDR